MTVGGQPQGSADSVQGGPPGQPAHRQPLHTVRSRGEHSDLVGELGRAAVCGNGPGQPTPAGAHVDEHGLAGGRAGVVAEVAGLQRAGAFPLPPPWFLGEGALVCAAAASVGDGTWTVPVTGCFLPVGPS